MANQFVWQVALRQDVLDDAMAELRGLSYEVMRRIVDNPLKKKGDVPCAVETQRQLGSRLRNHL